MEKKKNIFLNRDGKSATLLQILIASMTFLLISIIGQGIIAGLLYKLTQMNLLPPTVLESYFLSGILPETFLNILAGSLILLWYRLLNKKSLKTMGFTSLFKDGQQILFGSLTILVVLAVTTGVLVFIGDIQFTGMQFSPSIFQYVLLMAGVSFVEEVLNRGFIQHLIESRFSLIWSYIIPSLVFMLFHVANPGITAIGLINVFLMGVFFSVATHNTKSIWFGFGAHLTWNVGSACIFGLMDISSVTGSILNFSYIRTSTFNGNSVSPLYGLITTFFCLLLIAGFSIGGKKKQ